MACGEFGPGRMAEPGAIADAILARLNSGSGPKQSLLAGRSALVTSGPTHEPIDPVRYIANRSSGKQGHAIAAALSSLGADVTLVSGPTHLPAPAGVRVVAVERAEEMLAACRDALPADVAVFAAAVADWHIAGRSDSKVKKQGGAPPPTLELIENPDILKIVAGLSENRPLLVVGFAAETGDVVEKAIAKRARKGCDWIVANDVSDGTGTFGGDENTVHLITDAAAREDWPPISKQAVADRLAARIAAHFGGETVSAEG